MRNLSQTERQEAVNEIRLLASVQQNAAISGFHEAFIDGNRLCIVMEYAPFGDLSRALRKRQLQKKLLPEDLIWSYFIQIARGLQALHAQKILHRDVKTANVLRMSGEIVKLGDLGVAKLMKDKMTNTQIGTPHYMPPEVWRNRPYTFNSDVWALGCVLFEMCTFVVPFEARSMEELRFKVMKGKFPSLPAVYSSDMQKMVRWLMIAEPSQRPDVNQVLEHASVRRRAHLAPEPEPLVSSAGDQSKAGNGAMAKQSESESGNTAVTLGTIKVPKNLKMLKQRLPAASYPSDHEKFLNEKMERAEREKKRLQGLPGAPGAGVTEMEGKKSEGSSESASASSNAEKVGNLAAACAALAQAPVRNAQPAAASRPAALARKPSMFSFKPKPETSDVAPLHKPNGNRENNLGNGYGNRLVNGAGAISARDRAAAAAERARNERERAVEIREMRAEMHRERSGISAGNNANNEHKKPSANVDVKNQNYAAAPSRVKLPLISGNGAVVGGVVANRQGPGYAPAAPLPGGRNGAQNQNLKPFGVFGKNAGDEENAVGENNVGGKNPAVNDKRRVGLSNLSNLDGKVAARGAVRQQRRPAPMARNFYF